MQGRTDHEGAGRRVPSPAPALVVLLTACAGAAAQGWPEIVLEPVIAGLDRPVHVTSAGDGSGRLFVVEQEGRIKVVPRGAQTAETFLDISDRVSCCGERGLLSAAFPPAYPARRHVYVYYTDRAGTVVVSRFAVSAETGTGSAGSEEVVLTVPQPFANHNGGQLAFGPDGYLYIGTGDGGSAGDPQNNAQNPASLLGKLLRIDVESGERPYGIPESNPFAGSETARGEIWALGLRNPWRFSFDRATGDLWIGDVGQSSLEEVDVQGAASPGGENYGWRVLEGSRCYQAASCDATGFVPPVFEYGHDLGCSVTGGFVSRAPVYPDLGGIYFLGDYCSGRIWGVRRAGGSWQAKMLLDSPLSISSFGEGEDGRLYVADLAAGTVHAIADARGAVVLHFLVPAVAHLPGLDGSFWRTSLALVNASPEPAALTLTLIAGESSSQVGWELPPSAAVEWRDVAESAFGVSPVAQLGGVIRVRSTAPLVGGARTYNETARGRFGQFVPLLTLDDAVTPGRPGVVGQLKRDAEFYSNLGVVNLGEVAATVRVALHDGTGAELGSPFELTVPVDGWVQSTDVLAAAGAGPVELAWAAVEVLTSGAAAWAYGSVIDRSSRDPVTVAVARR